MIPLLRPLVKHFRAPAENFCRCRWGSCVGEALYASRCLMRRQQWSGTQGSGARIGAGRLETVPYMCGGGLGPSLSVGTPVLRCPKCPARHGGHLGAVSLRVCQHGKCRTRGGAAWGISWRTAPGPGPPAGRCWSRPGRRGSSRYSGRRSGPCSSPAWSS